MYCGGRYLSKNTFRTIFDHLELTWVPIRVIRFSENFGKISLKFEVPINNQPQAKKYIILSEKSTPAYFFYIFLHQGRVS